MRKSHENNMRRHCADPYFLKGAESVSPAPCCKISCLPSYCCLNCYCYYLIVEGLNVEVDLQT